MDLVVLGSGTSTGVPVIGCDCDTCTSSDPRNRRLRASVLLTHDGKNILIDTSTDLRYQALKYNIRRVDAVLYTHSHGDHVHGIDEIRSFNFLQKERISCFGGEETLNQLRSMYGYIFNGSGPGAKWPSVPQLDAVAVSGAFDLFGLRVVPIPIFHGAQTIFGYRLGNFAYITDCSAIPPSSMDLLKGLRTLILGALGPGFTHPNHFSLEEAIDAAQNIRPDRVYFTHLSHRGLFEEVQAALPPGMYLAYDGLRLSV
jgi:phosphoribosyl 1,2-cyclic phosphate phosphodiesterase